jgi:hypothetical protein
VTFPRAEEVGPGEVVKRILLAGIDPFRVFAEISRRPDGVGAFACMLMLAIAHFLGNSTLVSKVVLYTAKGEAVKPEVLSIGDVRRVVAVNATSFRRMGPLNEENYAALNMLSLGYALVTWIAWALALWLSVKLVGGSTGPVVVLSGYMLSSKIYENLTKAVILAVYLRGLSRIELFLAQSAQRVSAIMSLVSLAIAEVSGLQTALLAHMAFFAVWNLVVSTAAVYQGGLVPLKRSIVGGVIAYILASFIQSVAYTLIASTI